MLKDLAAFVPVGIDDRAAWDAMAGEPRHAAMLAAVEERAGACPPAAPMPSATDFLAARRFNDRAPLDRHWQGDRIDLAALALRRLLKGAQESDDRLLNWIWSFLSEPTWAVSAHLPGTELPALGRPTLDLAACEMAAMMAELRETLGPWLRAQSDTLADSIVSEIDRRVLGPYAGGQDVWWDPVDGDAARLDRINNWTGVCCGSILAACVSLEAQGHPRSEARARAERGLRLFFERAFTEHGECDEGLGYWLYGMDFACMGLSRLNGRAIEAVVDAARLRQVADYPRLSHLFDDCFFSGNDGGLRARPLLSFVPWLASLTGNEFLSRWCADAPPRSPWVCRHLGHFLRVLASPAIDATAPLAGEMWPRLLPDQQAGLFTAATPRGPMVACLSGGHNAERHNHNDLGHFLVALNRQIIVPDLGAPYYTADFFGPNRYTYLSASSRGHCCPIIDGCEQVAGRAAAGRVESWHPNHELSRLRLDLTAAYPPAAGLLSWVRQLRGALEHEAPARFVIDDHFGTRLPDRPIVEVVWSAIEPHIEPATTSEQAVSLGPLRVLLSPAPRAMNIVAVDPREHRLRDYPTGMLYRIEAMYRTDSQGLLSVSLTLGT